MFQNFVRSRISLVYVRFALKSFMLQHASGADVVTMHTVPRLPTSSHRPRHWLCTTGNWRQRVWCQARSGSQIRQVLICWHSRPMCGWKGDPPAIFYTYSKYKIFIIFQVHQSIGYMDLLCTGTEFSNYSQWLVYVPIGRALLACAPIPSLITRFMTLARTGEQQMTSQKWMLLGKGCWGAMQMYCVWGRGDVVTEAQL